MNIININKIIIKNRARKSYGDIESLAADIKENGIIHPPAVNKDTLELIAGERRIRAAKLLGYTEIPVNLISVRDAEHKLNLEISENAKRLDFNKEERIALARELERIETQKARERVIAAQNNDAAKAAKEKFPGLTSDGQVRDIVAEKLGIGSGRQYDKEKFIVDHKDELTDEIYEQWKIGAYSTGKAYNEIKKILDDRNFAESEAGMQIANVKLLSEKFPAFEDLVDSGIPTVKLLEEILSALSEEDRKTFTHKFDSVKEKSDPKAEFEKYKKELLDKYDSDLKRKYESLNEEVRLLKENKEISDTLIDQLNARVDEYDKIKSDIIDMGLEPDGPTNLYRAASEISQLNVAIQEMLEDKLSVVKYKPFMFAVRTDGLLRESFLRTISQVKDWYDSIIEYVEPDEVISEEFIYMEE